ncbi:TPA: hypothetical protein ACP2PI_004068 [Escherichia coli]|uniref:hypothetical protein n=1 Tax=Escherichia coli TaxID=562 RepID=UPI000509A048|nr:hypothetical protein [Escherichia coli]EEU9292249.1 hypothetical protein [Escherichia coli]EKK2853843.1 hypothetical protein [Escherichia coli]KAE9949349.1 hypothetical protein GP645_03870 [Escherichia coli]MDY9023821.1 hypothetical protein [Escherichia coli]NEN54306.1 hypothetical protein [Escherichia coli]
MKVIKYWKVQLLQLSQPSSIINARNLVESLLFEGYSRDKPKINLGSGVNIELFTAPDSLETRIFRDHLVDSVRCFPVCEDDGDKSEGVDITIHLEPQISKCRAVIGGAGAAKAPEKIHDHACINCFLGRGPCLGDCHVADVNKARSSSFEDVVKPVIKWLNENANPHTSVNIDATSAQLLTGEIGIHTEEFIKD